MTPRRLVAVAALCAPLAACASLGSPGQPSVGARTPTTHELPTPAPRQTVPGPGAATPAQAVRRFADAYINWTADGVGRDMRDLAAASIGQARSALQLAAAQTAGDYELKRGGIANSGTVEVVAALPATRNHYLVVTRESTTATNSSAYRGLLPAWHVAIATVALLPRRGYVVRGWQPES